ncbi:LysR family transcriptional regulator [Jiella pacifica]|uniref:LysR family transcriptional regulator n=1 Tax=Jiella pacifica TaxID=2696469 RepID=A0A6N9TDJ5_9HYPH|nr:LysR substrate-binding domain-containing protein [Jiella pacifica]NDW06938.1 LysR family transcriptional regulator [Jiella pacifica]
MAPPNIRQLSAFNAIMKAGSVTEAAERLFVSQPAVTKLLKGFEEACGFRLFERGQGRLKPTAEARQMFAETEKLEAGMMRISRLAESIRNLERGEVSAVTFPGLSMHVAPQAAAAILARSPQVRLQLFSRTSRSIEDAMVTGKADFGIGLLPSTSASLQSEKFVEVELFLALPADHRLVGHDNVDVADLDGERLIALGREDLSYPVIEAAFHRAEAKMNPVAEVQMADAACEMVAAGVGISVVPSLASAGVRDGRLVFKRLRQPIQMTSWLITPRGEAMSMLAASFLEEIRTRVRGVQEERAPASLASAMVRP